MTTISESFSAFITGAPSATTPTGTELVPLIQGGATKQAQLLAAGRIRAAATVTPVNAAFTLNVNPSGSDVTGNGSASNPFQTPYHALTYAQNSLDPGAGAVIIQMAHGTYTAALRAGGTHSIVEMYAGSPLANFLFQGDLASPSSVIWDLGKNGDGGFYGLTAGANLQFQGFTILQSDLTGTNYGGGIVQFAPGTLSWNNMIFGANFGAHIWLGNEAKGGGSTYTINGNADAHILVDDYSANVQLEKTTVTISGTPNFGTAFVYAHSGSGVTSAGVTYSGSATGKRFKLGSGGILNVQDSSFNPLGLTALPGNAAGISDGSGIYNGNILGNGGILVSALPTGVPAGTRNFVTDATATTFNSIVAGLGGNAVPVVMDNAGNWRIG